MGQNENPGTQHTMGNACVNKCQTSAALMQLEPKLPIGGDVTLELGKAKLFPNINAGAKIGMLTVKLMDCRQLGKADLFGADPYLTLQVGGQWYRSKGTTMDGLATVLGSSTAQVLAMAGVINKSTAKDYEPTKSVDFGGEQFIFDVYAGTPAMRMTMWDSDTFTADDHMGSGCVFLDALADGRPHERWIALAPAGSEGKLELKLAGEVRVQMQFKPLGVLLCGKCGFTMPNSSLIGHVEADEFAMGRESTIRREFEEPDAGDYFSSVVASQQQQQKQSVSSRNTFWCAWANERGYMCRQCGSTKKWDPVTFDDTSWMFNHWQSPFAEVTAVVAGGRFRDGALGKGGADGEQTTEVGLRADE